MAQTLGYNILEVSKGRVVAAAEPHAGHLNPAGTVHGGLAATLLDSCMGLAIRSMLDRGFAQTTLEFKIPLWRALFGFDLATCHCAVQGALRAPPPDRR